jgi:hypothetical protein
MIKVRRGWNGEEVRSVKLVPDYTELSTLAGWLALYPTGRPVNSDERRFGYG